LWNESFFSAPQLKRNPLSAHTLVLSDDEIERIAESHVRSAEHSLSRAGRYRLELVKHCDVDVPAGLYFTMRVVAPAGDSLIGPGGFFVDRSNGTIEAFGSGELAQAVAIVYANEPLATRRITPAVVKMLFRQRSPDAIPEPPFDRGTLGEGIR